MVKFLSQFSHDLFRTLVPVNLGLVLFPGFVMVVRIANSRSLSEK